MPHNHGAHLSGSEAMLRSGSPFRRGGMFSLDDLQDADEAASLPFESGECRRNAFKNSIISGILGKSPLDIHLHAASSL
jgi:hypothetical protein